MVMLYNDTYAAMSRTKHPRIFAKPADDAWGELWGQFAPIARRVHSGESVASWDGECSVLENFIMSS
jgi:hypothetical protein